MIDYTKMCRLDGQWVTMEEGAKVMAAEFIEKYGLSDETVANVVRHLRSCQRRDELERAQVETPSVAMASI